MPIFPHISDEEITLKEAAIYCTRQAQFWQAERERIGELQQADTEGARLGAIAYKTPEQKATVLAAHAILVDLKKDVGARPPRIADVKEEIAAGKREAVKLEQIEKPGEGKQR